MSECKAAGIVGELQGCDVVIVLLSMRHLASIAARYIQPFYVH